MWLLLGRLYKVTTNVDFSLPQCCFSPIHCCTFTENGVRGERGEVKSKVSGINLVLFSRILQSQRWCGNVLSWITSCVRMIIHRKVKWWCCKGQQYSRTPSTLTNFTFPWLKFTLITWALCKNFAWLMSKCQDIAD